MLKPESTKVNVIRNMLVFRSYYDHSKPVLWQFNYGFRHENN